MNNREGWLTELAKKVEPVFRDFRFPPYRVTVGFPSSGGLSPKRPTIGQCHYPRESGGFSEVFISPVLEKVPDVAGTLVHELVHVILGPGKGHGPEFVKVAKVIGLTKGRPASSGPGKDLEERLLRIAETLGPYPHTALKPALRLVNRAPPFLRFECEKCGATFLITARNLATAGGPPPKCFCGGKFEGLF